MIAFRSDRLATLYLFHPLQKLPRRGPAAKKIPILMYHGIRDGESQARHPYFRTTTTPAVFAWQIGYLARSGYQSVRPDEAAALLLRPERGPAKPVVITFDDGLQDFYTAALPVLRKYGMSATVYLPTACIGQTARKFHGRDCMTWAQVRDSHREGIAFGSHTVTHPQLKALADGAIRRELEDSKKTLEDELGAPVSSFSYPYAFPETDIPFRSRLRAMLEETGYSDGVSTIIGTAGRRNDPYFLRRIPVNAWDDIRLFQAKLEGGYDWLRSLQYLSKLVS